MNNERGFTLVEMLVVLLIISVLILVTIPNVSKHFASIDKKGCDAYILMVQGQVEAYKLEEKTYPGTIQDLVDKEYLQEHNKECPNGDQVVISAEGKVESSMGNGNPSE